jgi:uncharacterized membrane protein
MPVRRNESTQALAACLVFDGARWHKQRRCRGLETGESAMELREHAIDAARERELDARAVDRLVFFSDAVIAIIITLMVLEVRLPVLPEHVGEAEVLRAILALWPKYLAVVLSYLVIGLFWTLHHRRFNWVRRVDATLVWLNLLYLLAIACVPFATSLTAEHPGRTSTIVYAGVLGLATMISALLWRHVGRRPEIMASATASREMHLATLMSVASAGVFVVSIGVAFSSSSLAQYFWVLVFFANRAARYAYDWRHAGDRAAADA